MDLGGAAEAPLPATGLFAVQDGFNVVDLGNLGSGLSGARVTFVATQANNVLTMSALKITAPKSSNVSLKSPFFVVHPRSGKVNADPKSNGFDGDLTVDAGTTRRNLFSGKMIILRWDAAGQLKLVFTELTAAPLARAPRRSAPRSIPSRRRPCRRCKRRSTSTPTARTAGNPRPR